MKQSAPRPDPGPDTVPVDPRAGALLELALAYRHSALWREVDPTHPIAIRSSQRNEVSFALLQREHAEVGCTLLRGPNALRALEAWLARERPPYECMADGQLELACLSFQPCASIEAGWQSLHSLAGRSFEPGAAAPVLESWAAHGVRHPLAPRQWQWFAEALETMLLAERAGVVRTRRWDERRRMLELERDASDARVHDRVSTLAAEECAASPALAPTTLAAWHAAARELGRRQSGWIIGALALPQDSWSEPRQEALLVLDDEARAPLAVATLRAGDPDQLAAALIDRFRESSPRRSGEPAGPGLPAWVSFVHPHLQDSLGEAFAEVGIETRAQVAPRSLEAVLEELDGLTRRLRKQHLRSCSPAEAALPDWRAAEQVLEHELFSVASLSSRPFDAQPMRRYWGSRRAGMRALDADETGALEVAYCDWFLYDYRPGSGKPTAAERLRDAGALPALAAALLDARLGGRTSVYRVVSTDPGASLLVENILSGERVRVDDGPLSAVARAGLGLFLRLAALPNWTLASLAGPPLAPLWIEPVVSRLEESELDIEAGYLKGELSILGRLWIEFQERPEPTLLDSEGNPIEPWLLTYRVRSERALRSALAASPGIEADGESAWLWVEEVRDRQLQSEPQPAAGGPIEHGFQLLASFERVRVGAESEGPASETSRRVEEVDPTSGAPVELRLLASLQLVGDELLVEVESLGRARSARSKLDGLAALEFIGRSRPPEAELPDHHRSSEQDLDLERRVREQYEASVMDWLDARIPALGGKTPREAFADPASRSKVVRMIRSYPESSGPFGPISPPRDRMLAQLHTAPG